MGIKEMLELRKNMKAKKPHFLRQNAVNKKRVSFNYRKPKGCSSRMRTSKIGYPPKVSPGYQSPRLVKGLTLSGLKPVIVGSVGALSKMDKTKDAVVISSKAGARKVLDLYSEAKKLGFTIDNVDEKRIEELKSSFAKRKDERKSKLAAKKAKDKVEETKKEAKKEENVEEKKDANVEKKEEVKTKEKIVTSKKTAM